MRYAIILCLALSGCAMTAGDMVATRKVCADAGMGVRWFRDGISGMIQYGQCDPSVKP